MNRMLKIKTSGLFFHILLVFVCFVSPPARSCPKSLTALLSCWSQWDLCSQVKSPPCSVKCSRWVLPGQPGHCRTPAGLPPGSCPHPRVPAQHPQLQHFQMWLLQQNLPAESTRRKVCQIAWADLREKRREATREKKQQFCIQQITFQSLDRQEFSHQMLMAAKNHRCPLLRLCSKLRTESVAESWLSLLWEQTTTGTQKSSCSCLPTTENREIKLSLGKDVQIRSLGKL